MIRRDAIDELPSLAPAPQTQAAPTPDYRSDLPPEIEVCSCDEALALRRELALARAQARSPVELPDRGFCPQCGVGIGFDDEGCCTGCGSTVCSMRELAAHLARAGLRLAIVPEAER